MTGVTVAARRLRLRGGPSSSLRMRSADRQVAPPTPRFPGHRPSRCSNGVLTRVPKQPRDTRGVGLHPGRDVLIDVLGNGWRWPVSLATFVGMPSGSASDATNGGARAASCGKSGLRASQRKGSAARLTGVMRTLGISSEAGAVAIGRFAKKIGSGETRASAT